MKEVKLSDSETVELPKKEESGLPTFTKPKHNQLKSLMNTFRMVFLTMLVAAFIYLLWAVYDGLNNTINLETRNNPPACQHDNCIAFKGRYKDGTATWFLQENWPVKLSVMGTTFSQNDIPVVIRCPIDKPDNDLLAKLSFLVTQDKLDRCTVNSK